jgi:hypothetical protein
MCKGPGLVNLGMTGETSPRETLGTIGTAGSRGININAMLVSSPVFKTETTARRKGHAQSAPLATSHHLIGVRPTPDSANPDRELLAVTLAASPTDFLTEDGQRFRRADTTMRYPVIGTAALIAAHRHGRGERLTARTDPTRGPQESLPPRLLRRRPPCKTRSRGPRSTQSALG